MEHGKALSATVVGVTGHLIEVDAGIGPGRAAFQLEGLPRHRTATTKDRLRAAITNSGHRLPSQQITVELSPYDVPKLSTSLDLAIAVAILDAADLIAAPDWRHFVYIGELGLDGSLRPVRGIVPAALAAVAAGHPNLVVAQQNVIEAQLVPGAQVHGVRTLSDVIYLNDSHPPDDPATPAPDTAIRPAGVDMADVPARHPGRYALEVAAAGGHHLLLTGPAGTGKTTLAHRLPGLLPDLDDTQAMQVTAIHSIAGTLDPAAGLIHRPPFESPHHTATAVTMSGGGGNSPQPGAASRAHRGVLFLDDAPEFRTQALDCLRPALEDGEMVIHRITGTAVFPARFQLVLAADPVSHRDLARLPAWLLDRVDLKVELPAMTCTDLASLEPPEDSATIAVRVARARAAQRERLAGTAWTCNAEIPGGWLRGDLHLPATVTADIDQALDRGQLSIRGYDKVLRTSWTLADLDGLSRPGRIEVARAFALRPRGGTR